MFISAHQIEPILNVVLTNFAEKSVL